MKNKIIIIITIIILLIGTGVTCYYIGYNNSKNNSNNEDTNNNQNEISYKEYKTYDEITLTDESKWIVIENSPKESDYVTLIRKEDIAMTSNDTYTLLSNEILNSSKVTYDTSNLKKYVDSQIENIPVKLKEINGYKIRLITINELIKLDSNWEYDEVNDNYSNTKNTSNLNLLVGLTMSNTKCNSEKCTPFYIVTAGHQETEEESITTNYYIQHWDSGLPQIKPVINVYKSELE